MRILLICTPRSGTNSFISSLSKTMGINQISIPDSYQYPRDKSLIDYLISKENIIVRMNPNHQVGYDIIEFSNLFDVVILLTRKNIDKLYESYVNLFYKEVYIKGAVNSTYDYKDIPNNIKNSFKNDINWKNVLNGINIINDISDKLNIPILYYEDLYYSNDGINLLKSLLPEINTDVFRNRLSSTKKLRVDIDKKII
jgi:hypothetical protein